LFEQAPTLPMEPAIAEIFARKFDPADRNALAAIGAAFNELVTNEHATVESKVTTGTQILAVVDESLEAETFAHDVLTFMVGTLTAEILQHRGERIGALAHLQHALSLPTADGGWEVRPERLRLWEPLADYLDIVLVEVTLRHCGAWYAAAWRQPALDDLANGLWEYLLEIVQEVKRAPRSVPPAGHHRASGVHVGLAALPGA
jgi:hypothetical protein